MNPFIVSGFEGPEYFCDRKNELAKLREAFDNKRNVTLFSLRRMGKSALVKYHYKNISGKAECIYVDIFPARNLTEFTEIFAKCVSSQIGKSSKDYMDKMISFVKSLGASLSFNEFTGNPEISLDLGSIKNYKKSLEEIFNYLEKNKKRVVISFDEFQQIRTFPEKNTEAILRTLIQNYKNISFIFLGSNKGILESVFTDNTKPFYHSTQFLMLEEIHQNEYAQFITEKFNSGKRKIKKEAVDMLLDLCRNHTYYVQYFCNRLYSKDINIKESEVYEVQLEILSENEPVYFNYKNLLTDIQWKLTSAIAEEEKVKEPLSISFIKKYNLNSASTLKRALESLLKKEIIIFYNGQYIVYDVFFSLWLKKNKL